MKLSGRRLIAACGVALALFGTVQLLLGIRIHLKAHLANILLARAWERSLEEGIAMPPWPGADTRVVAHLEAPRLGVARILLAGASGSSMAFAAGHLAGSAPPGDDGNTVLAGHRDTHFGFLEELEVGDELQIQSLSATRSYRVASLTVVNERDLRPLEPSEVATLTLITCFPFRAVRPGGPLRYVVQAVESQPRAAV